MHRNPVIVSALNRLKTVHYTLIGLAITAVVVSCFSVYFHGRVTADYLTTGAVTCILVSLLVVGMQNIHKRALGLEIQRRQDAEAEKDRLITLLQQSLQMQQELAEMKDREKQHAVQLLIKNEKLKTLQQAMGKVLHYMNNLANNLQLVALEYRADNALSDCTLDTLDRAILECSDEMKALARIDDPFEEEPFRVRVQA